MQTNTSDSTEFKYKLFCFVQPETASHSNVRCCLWCENEAHSPHQRFSNFEGQGDVIGWLEWWNIMISPQLQFRHCSLPALQTNSHWKSYQQLWNHVSAFYHILFPVCSNFYNNWNITSCSISPLCFCETACRTRKHVGWVREEMSCDFKREGKFI